MDQGKVIAHKNITWKPPSPTPKKKKSGRSKRLGEYIRFYYSKVA
jgi:hypothetical protein